MKIARFTMMGALLIAAALWFPACGGGSSTPPSDNGGVVDDGGDGDDTDGSGGESGMLPINAGYAVETAMIMSAFYPLKALGFDVNLDALYIPAASMNKMTEPANVRCMIDMSGTLACPFGGSVMVTGDCRSAVAPHVARVMIADFLIVDDACQIAEGLVTNGSRKLTLILSEYQGTYDDMQIHFVLRAEGDYTVTGDVTATIEELEFDAQLDADGFDIKLALGTVEVGGGITYCSRNIAGGTDCSFELGPPSEIDYCYDNLDFCTVGDEGDAYCRERWSASFICARGCCAVPPPPEFSCTNEHHECKPEGYYSSYNKAQDVTYNAPLMCRNQVSTWQIPCLGDIDCRYGAICDGTPPDRDREVWSEFRTSFIGYGYCGCFSNINNPWNERNACWVYRIDNEECCSDGIDNDGNGPADCDDPDCLYFCTVTGEKVCSDGIDNDMDKKIDCADPDCFCTSDCPSVSEVCDDGHDNDCDGDVDCADSDCSLDPWCNCSEYCPNGTWCEIYECVSPHECLKADNGCMCCR